MKSIITEICEAFPDVPKDELSIGLTALFSRFNWSIDDFTKVKFEEKTPDNLMCYELTFETLTIWFYGEYHADDNLVTVYHINYRPSRLIEMWKN